MLYKIHTSSFLKIASKTWNVELLPFQTERASYDGLAKWLECLKEYV